MRLWRERALWVVVCLGMASAAPAQGQVLPPTPADSAATPSGAEVALPDSAPASPTASSGGLPVFLTLGVGYGLRRDGCAFCSAPENTESFSAHLSLGKYLGKGLGVGVDASVWRRGHPGPMGEADSTGVASATTLSNMLGNASVTFSYQLWHLFLRAGGGVAWAHQDVEETNAEGGEVVSRASGLGIGYSAGGGIKIPLAGPTSLVFFGNWNAGRYDLVSPTAVLKRKARHQYVEVGMGITLR